MLTACQIELPFTQISILFIAQRSICSEIFEAKISILLYFCPTKLTTCMKRILLIISSLLSIFAIFAQKNPKKLEISHLIGDFYIYTTYNLYQENLIPSNSMYVLAENGAIMIDTPWDSTQFQPLLDSIAQKHQQKVVLCVSTHSHEDRTGGLDFLKKKGIKTYSSLQTLNLCKQKGEKQAEYFFIKDTTFSIGNHSFQTFYAGEGHTPDNIVIWFEKEKVLYGGCFIKSTESPSLGNLQDANPTAWTASIQKMQQQLPKPKFIIPGHFGWKNKKSVAHTLRLLRKYHQKNKK